MSSSDEDRLSVRSTSAVRSASANFDSHSPTSESGPYEKFPAFGGGLGRKVSVKSKSLTEAEVLQGVIVEDLPTVRQRLKSQESPPSYEEAKEAERKRSASNKEIRRDAVSLLRTRTASRAAAAGQPILENIEKGKKE